MQSQRRLGGVPEGGNRVGDGCVIPGLVLMAGEGEFRSQMSNVELDMS